MRYIPTDLFQYKIHHMMQMRLVLSMFTITQNSVYMYVFEGIPDVGLF